jgi:hypothetical protein
LAKFLDVKSFYATHPCPSLRLCPQTGGGSAEILYDCRPCSNMDAAIGARLDRSPLHGEFRVKGCECSSASQVQRQLSLHPMAEIPFWPRLF